MERCDGKFMTEAVSGGVFCRRRFQILITEPAQSFRVRIKQYAVLENSVQQETVADRKAAERAR